ncbi:MAG: VOC family protein [Candidatus Brocadiia bacterium]
MTGDRNSEYRAKGKARIDAVSSAKTQKEWQRIWKDSPPSPIRWRDGQYCWKATFEYCVTDFAAEVGFFTDVLFLPVLTISENYVMFSGENEDFHFSIVPAEKGKETPPGTFAMEFMLDDIFAVHKELESKGVQFEKTPVRYAPQSKLFICEFRTPNGILVRLWSIQDEPVDRDEEAAGGCCTPV